MRKFTLVVYGPLSLVDKDIWIKKGTKFVRPNADQPQTKKVLACVVDYVSLQYVAKQLEDANGSIIGATIEVFVDETIPSDMDEFVSMKSALRDANIAYLNSLKDLGQ